MSLRYRIYIAGPYTKPDPCINTNKAILIANQLMELGYVPFIPHLTHFWHTVTPKLYKEWLEYDKEWLKVCDAVLRLSGESNGADEEIKVAAINNIRIFYDIETLHAYFYNKI